MKSVCNLFLLSITLLFIAACPNSPSDPCPAALNALTPQARKLAQCSPLEVPLSRTSNLRDTLKLSLIRFSSPTPNSKPPVVYLEGGPGGSVIRSANNGPFISELLQRDVIYFGQRGTQYTSTPITQTNWASFNTIESAEDIALLSTTLGTKFVLWGSSYGTLLAQRVVQRHPEAIDSLILEGSISSDGSEQRLRDVEANQIVLQRFSAWVKKKWAEGGLSPADINPEVDFPAAIAALAQYPSLNGVPFETLPLNVQYYARVGRNIPSLQLPLSLWAYNLSKHINGNATAAYTTSLTKIFEQSYADGFSQSMFFATNCFDEYQFWSSWEITAAANASGLPASMATAFTDTNHNQFSNCRNLSPSTASYPPNEFRIPTRSNINTLFLIGMLDTQTPAEWAPVDNFSNAKIVRGECIGHTFFEDRSLYDVLESFVNHPDRPISTASVEKYCDAPIQQPTLSRSNMPASNSIDMN